MIHHSLIEGVVIDSSDPQQMGRVRVWCPALDGDDYRPENIPWATYVSPLGGQTSNYPAGSSGTPTTGHMSYGFWAIPKVGSIVMIALMYGDPMQRHYLGSIFRPHGNRSLPQGRNRSDLANVPLSDTFDSVEPQNTNLSQQFNGKLDAPEALTRGVYERSVAQGVDNRDGSEGYQNSVVPDAGLDPQTYCLVTPGRHAIIMQDNPATGRMRLKTADGHQIILDDANERIYISTAKGNTWIEMDSDGHVHMYGASSISVSSGADMNFTANGNINLLAGGNINLSSGGWLRGSACSDISLSGKGLNIESTAAVDLKASGYIHQTGSQIHLNGPPAKSAPCADKPDITPDHEPWTRPDGVFARNKNWKK